MESVELIKLILIPLVAALIGWATNWVAIKMLFHPKKPVVVLGITFQGVFHRRQKELAVRLGGIIEERLFSHDDIHQKLTSPAFIGRLTPILEKHLDLFLKERLVGLHPMLALVPAALIESFREKMMAEFETFLPHLMEGASEALEDLIQVKEVIREKIEAFEVEQLEEMLFSIMKNEFKMIEWVGGVLGFLIGLFQVGITLL
ncbi:MAG: hypothetical protein A2600_04475 [Candidatus Lambdaproteobacteria bacterium RIFOXYD1_FULL_56_27]|uniref:DUF445 domain-containing protein n=1 Tax=Candidatus Lambdaproteobacteria bacterium RIFOXYD2_FULL_56_26 TaxID=1817773 RepID=A0A1F6H3Q8_9PROT|nr:MAG: hypothetical protein A2426_13540 [Candidatus Lambdaproteobacteria bacterium RIFOXYC1_FULL_56_13]OGH05009.1 MAG: hypothetical protein A2557_08540 [Candidatus Lambdaproteobacteria bacterium RIFOXYD2_FULL_56_26]OGH09474.1 MAG: hypothetical protein A2600_04475 [Candidatus Lambdaproteobacteria bacterium RIFOXYD1_FULL_56_27]